MVSKVIFSLFALNHWAQIRGFRWIVWYYFAVSFRISSQIPRRKAIGFSPKISSRIHAKTPPGIRPEVLFGTFFRHEVSKVSIFKIFKTHSRYQPWDQAMVDREPECLHDHIGKTIVKINFPANLITHLWHKGCIASSASEHYQFSTRLVGVRTVMAQILQPADWRELSCAHQQLIK